MTDINMEIMRFHSYQEFQTWLTKDFEIRAELEAIIGVELNIDEISLDTLETFLLGRYRNSDDILGLSERGILDAAARHIGLVMILSIDGAAWAINLDNEDDIYYRLPVIRLSDGAEECPLAMVTAALYRRTGNYLRTVVENYEEDYNVKMDK